MGRWTPDEHGCIYDETGCFARLTPNKAERLASRHNADIDALTAERDAWRNAVIDAAVVNWTYTAEDEDDPYHAVNKMVACAAKDALDPQISLDAKALHDRIAELQRRLDDILVAVAKEEGGNNHEFHPCNLVCREIRVIAEGREG